MAKMPIMDRSISGVTKGREAMLNLKHLDYFYEVARCGSITKAATKSVHDATCAQ